MYDVAIIGGGLAGLSLALQISQLDKSLQIIVIERRQFPPPVAAHKVGEATVEIGAHYLAHTLGLRELLEGQHLRKFGLRLFFGAGHHDDLAAADELGASTFLPAISYQLDRGALELQLAERLDAAGIEFQDNWIVKDVTLGDADANHRLSLESAGRRSEIECRWVIDASSRGRFLKRKLKLTEPMQHQMCAAWFRVESEFSVDEWSTQDAWLQRCGGATRRLSTNHLMGSGYWIWIIPLAGGKTSIGLVADPAIHPLSEYNSYPKFIAWLQKHQPLLARQLQGLEPLDFLKLRNLAHSCKQLWSTNRWAITGEAGLFSDPLYSPGTDFIGLSNTLIADLITRDGSPAELAVRSSIYEKMFRSFYENTMSLYEGQYPGFGDARLMAVKLTWDYAYYWSVLAWLFFRERLTDLKFLRDLQPELERTRELNQKMQTAFRRRAGEAFEATGSGRFFNQLDIPLLVELNAALLEPGDATEQELRANCARLEEISEPLLDVLAAKPMRPCTGLGKLEASLG